MQFQSIESSYLCIFSSFSEFLYNSLDILNCHFFWSYVFRSLATNHFSWRFYCWRSPRLKSVLKWWMSLSATVPYLKNNLSASSMYCVHNIFPTLGLFIRVNSTTSHKPITSCRNLAAFCEYQTKWRPLRVIFNHKLSWHSTIPCCTHSRHWTHKYSIFHLDISYWNLIK